ncbi:transcription termination/antitermination protein NusG [Rhodosalinus sediminis]|uniref:transcription termination/antitermination protein NusG n=1 Tax=Rhodosalinus sediminis TaxID=1940533 RepID=UPI0023578126|nr:transcriptional activator RfaH [Rhodosalinus sediminis]
MTHPQWFAAQLKPNGLTEAERNLARQGFEVFCPALIETRRRRGRLADVRRPLFPGYLFIRFVPEAGHWRQINSTRGLTRLVQTDPRRPTPLPDALIDGIRARCDDDGLLGPDRGLAPGDRVRVIAGPFADVVGRIERMNENDRIRVMLEFMATEVRTEMPAEVVQKIA